MLVSDIAPARYRDRVKRLVAASLATLVAACAAVPPHRQLSAPEPTAPEDERLAAYERLFARGDEEARARETRSPKFVYLGDGSRVYHAEDLALVVAPDSPTARAATRVARASKRLESNRSALMTYVWATMIGMAASMAVVVGGVALDNDAMMIGGLGGTSVGILAMLIGPLVIGRGNPELGRKIEAGRFAAFSTYNKDLRKQLELCADRSVVKPCAPAPPVAAPAAPRPDGPVAPAPAGRF
jgi:hypothetical protein